MSNESGWTHIFGVEIGLEGLKRAQLNSFALIVPKGIAKIFHAYNSRMFPTEILLHRNAITADAIFLVDWENGRFFFVFVGLTESNENN